MKYFLALLTVLILRLDTYAQVTYSISGTVKNTKGEKIQSATVFITGTQKTTMSIADGSFSFKGIYPGNYVVVVNMLGYNSVKQAVTVTNHPETIDLVLADKEIALQEVVIAAKQQSPKDLKKFNKIFLGLRYDPKLCKILNPEIINFGHNDSTMTASTDDFLIIDNQFLGYRIKYLLKKFYCRNNSNGHFYDGDYSFEPLTGSVEQQQVWGKNRAKAYENSRMQFLRSLYTGTTRKEGFLIYRCTTNKSWTIERNTSDPQQFVTRTDSNFMNVNIDPRIMIVYDKGKAAQPDVISTKPPKTYVIFLGLPQDFTFLILTSKVDSRGSIADYTSYRCLGYWPVYGVAHQLPFEYQP
jgi:hypothetical protein